MTVIAIVLAETCCTLYVLQSSTSRALLHHDACMTIINHSHRRTTAVAGLNRLDMNDVHCGCRYIYQNDINSRLIAVTAAATSHLPHQYRLTTVYWKHMSLC